MQPDRSPAKPFDCTILANLVFLPHIQVVDSTAETCSGFLFRNNKWATRSLSLPFIHVRRSFPRILVHASFMLFISSAHKKKPKHPQQYGNHVNLWILEAHLITPLVLRNFNGALHDIGCSCGCLRGSLFVQEQQNFWQCQQFGGTLLPWLGNPVGVLLPLSAFDLFFLPEEGTEEIPKP
jgi:hypothetical protein